MNATANDIVMNKVKFHAISSYKKATTGKINSAVRAMLRAIDLASNPALWSSENKYNQEANWQC